MRNQVRWLVAGVFSATALLAVAGCVENKESIVVHPDGSLDVQMSAKGASHDLADGYALPLEGPWRALDDTTLAWIAQVGPDTGSAQTRERVAAGAWIAHETGQNDTQLSVAAHFASAAQLPRLNAPQREPYRSALLERETKLSIEHKGARAVYTFERKFVARRWAEWEVFNGLEDKLPEETVAKLEKDEALSDGDWLDVTRIVREQYRRSAANFARDALCAAYTFGDASLATSALSDALRTVDQEITEFITEPRLRAEYEKMKNPESEATNDIEPVNPDALVRDALRRSLSSALESADVSAATRNIVLARLEWDFTAFDQTGDIGDESFDLSVCVPGVAVNGNYDSSEALVVDGVACTKVEWSFKGEDMRDHDKSLRIVSIVE